MYLPRYKVYVLQIMQIIARDRARYRKIRSVRKFQVARDWLQRGGEISSSCERKILKYRSEVLEFYKALILELHFEIPRGKILLHDRSDT